MCYHWFTCCCGVCWYQQSHRVNVRYGSASWLPVSRWVWMRECVSRLISTCSRRLRGFSMTLSSRSTRSWSVTRIRGFLPLELSGICSTASWMRQRPASHSGAFIAQSNFTSTPEHRGLYQLLAAVFPASTCYYTVGSKLVSRMQSLSKSLQLIDLTFWCLLYAGTYLYMQQTAVLFDQSCEQVYRWNVS